MAGTAAGNPEAAAEIGPLKYVAKITGKDTDKVVNWFILLFIIVFDPLAVILLVSAQHSFKFNNTKNIYGETKNYFKERNELINKGSSLSFITAPSVIYSAGSVERSTD